MVSTTPLRYEFHLDAAEQVRASSVIRRRQWSQRFWLWLPPTLFLLGALVLLIGAGWTNALQVFAAAITLGVLQRLAPWLERRQLRRLSAQMPGTALPQIVEFSDAGVEFTNGPRTARLGWDAILEVEERNEFFLMFVAKHWAHYLPKRAIGGDPKETELRGMLSSKLGQRYSLSS